MRKADEEVTGDGEGTTTDVTDVTEEIGNNEEDESDLLPALPPREFETLTIYDLQHKFK